MQYRAIEIGYNGHDCDTVFRCQKCNHVFYGSHIYFNRKNKNGTNKYCPKCKEELKGLEGLNAKERGKTNGLQM